jgi:hypothetical protein
MLKLSMPSSRRRISTCLGFDEHEIYEKDHKVVFHIFVCKAFAVRALCQADTFSKRPIISFAVRCIEMLHRSAASDTYWHGS